MRLLFAALALTASFCAAAPAGKPVPQDPTITSEEFLQGTKRLRKHLTARGEDPALVEEFVGAIEKDVLARVKEGKPFPVKRDSFEAFLKYEAAWARKTRDAKNANVDPQKLAHEKQRSIELRDEFLTKAKGDSHALLAAYRDAVKKARAALAAQHGGDPSAAGAFDDQVDDSYSRVDAGDEALDQGDTGSAVADANAAIAENPDNADAYTLKAGAEYAAGDTSAAAADAQHALQLDPNNAQAAAIADLAGGSVAGGAAGATLPDGSNALMSQAGAVAGNLATGGSAPASAVIAAALPSATLAAANASATPALGQRLSTELTAQAARTASLDAGAAAQQLGRALALDPRNGEALNWVASLANRGGDYKTALAAADQALAVNNQDAHGWFAKGHAQAGLGADEAALASLQQAAKLDPTYFTAEEAFAAAKAAGRSGPEIASAGTAPRAAPASGAGFSAQAPEAVFVDPWLGQQAAFTRRPRRKKSGLPQIPPAGMAAFGALLLGFGIVQVFRSHDESRA